MTEGEVLNYRFQTITQEQAEDISYNWHYNGDYSFYDMKADQEDLQAFLNTNIRGNSIFAVTTKHELVAYFSMMTIPICKEMVVSINF